ncbi:hypothetical protein V6N13_074213 [Hibiscus sabdariffa]
MSEYARQSRFAALASEDDGTGSEQNLEADRTVVAAEALSDSRVEVEDITHGKRVIQGNGLKFNKAYMGSNPSRLSKSDKRPSVDPKEVAVVSLVEGVITEGIFREVSAKKGNHVAVLVLDGTQVPKVLDRPGEGSSKHNVRPNRGLRIKQQLGVRSSPRASVSNWVPGVMNMIDAEARRMQHGLEQNYEVMDDDDPDGGTSAAEMEDQLGMVRVTAVYASPVAHFRRLIWDPLLALDPGEDVPWLLGGDFNAILRWQERVGGSSRTSGVSKLFQDFVFASKLLEVEYVGADFTWRAGSLYQRLDRCFMNDVWSRKYPESCVFHLDRLGSDHCPLFVRTSLGTGIGVVRPFRYMAAWQDHGGFAEFLESSWNPQCSL